MALPDTNQTDAVLNDASTAAKSNDANAWRKVYQDVVALSQSDNGTARNFEKDDLPGLNQRLHAAGLLPGLEIVGVKDGQVLVASENNPSQVTAESEDQFVQETFHPANKATYANGTGMAVTTDADGKIQQVAEPDGSTFVLDPDGTYSRHSGDNVQPGFVLDQQTDGTISATNSADGSVQTFNPDGTSITRDKDGRIIGESKQTVDQDGNLQVMQFGFDYGADGNPTTVHVLINGKPDDGQSGPMKGPIEADGSFSYTTSSNNATVRETLAGASEVFDDNGNVSAIFRSDGTSVQITGTADSGVSQVSIFNQDGSLKKQIDAGAGVTIDKPAADGSITTHNGDGTLDLYKADGSVVHRDASGNVTEVTYPNGFQRIFDYNGNQLTGVSETGGAHYALNSDGAPKATVSADGVYSLDFGGGELQVRRTDGSISFTPAVGDVQATTPQPYTVTQADGNTYTYDESNRLSKVQSPAGSTVSYTYNGDAQTPSAVSAAYPDGSSMNLTQDANGNWTLQQAGGEPQQVSNFQWNNADGSVSFSIAGADGKGGNDTFMLMPDGSGRVHSDFSDGDTSDISWDSKHQVAQVHRTDKETGSQELVVRTGDGVGMIILTDKDGNHVEGTDVRFDAVTGNYSFLIDDGKTRVEQNADGSRLEGIAGDDGAIKQVNQVSWRDADGSQSSRSYKYDKDGVLVEATGTGTASNEHWTRLEDGSYKRENDGMVSMVSVDTADGSFKNIYRDNHGNVVAEIQHADGTVEKRDAKAKRGQTFGDSTGTDTERKATVYEDGSMVYSVSEGDTLANIAWDVLTERYGPDHQITDDELIALEDQICRDNHIADPNVISVDQSLVIEASVHQTDPISLGLAAA